MKSEERHRLHRNFLRDYVENLIEQTQPYWKAISGIAILVGLVILVLMWRMSQARNEASGSWNELYVAMSNTFVVDSLDRALLLSEQGHGVSPDPRDPSVEARYNNGQIMQFTVGKNATDYVAGMEYVVGEYPNSKSATWANILSAEMQLNQACNLLFGRETNVTESVNMNLEEAEEKFQLVKDKGGAEFKERASFGLARTYEAMSGTRKGLVDRAREAYKEVVDKWPGGVYADLAARRLEDLNQNPKSDDWTVSANAFYDKFAQHIADASQSRETPGSRLDFSSGSLRDDGGLSPLLGLGGQDDTETPDTETPDTETPDTETPEAEATPGESPPATEAEPAEAEAEPAVTDSEPTEADEPAEAGASEESSEVNP